MAVLKITGEQYTSPVEPAYIAAVLAVGVFGFS